LVSNDKPLRSPVSGAGRGAHIVDERGQFLQFVPGLGTIGPGDGVVVARLLIGEAHDEKPLAGSRCSRSARCLSARSLPQLDTVMGAAPCSSVRGLNIVKSSRCVCGNKPLIVSRVVTRHRILLGRALDSPIPPIQ
jgi:hypothetical protein